MIKHCRKLTPKDTVLQMQSHCTVSEKQERCRIKLKIMLIMLIITLENSLLPSTQQIIYAERTSTSTKKESLVKIQR